MTKINRSRQRGMTMIGWLILLAMLGFFVLVGLRLMPAYMEYFKVVNSVKSVAEQATADTSAADIRTALNRRFVVNDVSAISGSDVKLIKDGNKASLHFEYEVRTPMMGNVDAVVMFERSFEVGKR